MNEQKILIIEDEEITVMALEDYLESLGYIITQSVNNAEDAIKSVKREKPDLILSDIMIQGAVSGCEVSRDLHAKYNIPIIFLTAHIDDEILDYATDANAYGYILKPFKPLELKAMIRLALNHHTPNQKNNTIFFGEYSFINNQVMKNKEVIKLGKKSLRLIRILVHHSNRALSYEELLNDIWEDDNDRNIDNLRQLVKRTKEKLDKGAILSIKNIGYQIAFMN